MNSRRTRIRAIDLFAGAGGCTIGATAAGVRVVAAVDSWSLAKDTYRTNNPKVRFLNKRCEDVSLASFKKLAGSIDLILASPECTSHTCAKGSARRSEISRKTAYQVVRFARALRPRWILVENVVHMRRWSRFTHWIRQLEALGYNIAQQVVDAADHGVAQSRRRLFILCDRDAEPTEVPKSRRARKTVKSILSSNGAYKFSSLRTPTRAKATLGRAKTAFGAIGTKSPFLLVYYGSDAAGGWQRINRPLRTVTTLDRFAFVKPAKSGHLMRMLQVPEIQAAMGFPRSYRLNHGTRREQLKLLGNAVCPPVITAIVRSLTSKSNG